MRRFVPLALVLTTSLFAGCAKTSSAEAETTESAAAPVVDARYASAEALLETFNGYATAHPIDYDACASLLYAENESQRKLVKFATDMNRRSTMYTMVQEDGLATSSDELWAKMMPTLTGPATLETNGVDRATAEYRRTDGLRRTLHLVRIGERWWISGYTFEHDPSFTDFAPHIDDLCYLAADKAAFAEAWIADRGTGSDSARAAYRQRNKANQSQMMTVMTRISTALDGVEPYDPRIP